ncbi:MAG: FHA domain-containing protein, partial [bacterium]
GGEMANPTPGAGRLCAAGRHSMDPNWESCPYCEAERRAKERTHTQGGGGGYAPTTRAASEGRRTGVGGVVGGGQRETKTMPSGLPAGSGGQAGEPDTRRIVGVLVTYTKWRPEGQLFPIREGKNFIGAGDVSSEPTPRKCEILMDKDDQMSSEHALILYRARRYEIIDQKSSNGTFLFNPTSQVNELVPVQGMELPNYARLKTGSTEWTFIQITPPAGGAVRPPPVPPPRPASVEVPEEREPNDPTIVD